MENTKKCDGTEGRRSMHEGRLSEWMNENMANTKKCDGTEGRRSMHEGRVSEWMNERMNKWMGILCFWTLPSVRMLHTPLSVTYLLKERPALSKPKLCLMLLRCVPYTSGDVRRYFRIGGCLFVMQASEINNCYQQVSREMRFSPETN